METQKKRIKELKEEFYVSRSEITGCYYLNRKGKTLMSFGTSTDAKFHRDNIIARELGLVDENGEVKQ